MVRRKRVGCDLVALHSDRGGRVRASAALGAIAIAVGLGLLVAGLSWTTVESPPWWVLWSWPLMLIGIAAVMES